MDDKNQAVAEPCCLQLDRAGIGARLVVLLFIYALLLVTKLASLFEVPLLFARHAGCKLGLLCYLKGKMLRYCINIYMQACLCSIHTLRNRWLNYWAVFASRPQNCPRDDLYSQVATLFYRCVVVVAPFSFHFHAAVCSDIY